MAAGILSLAANYTQAIAEPPLLGCPSTSHSAATKHPILSLSAVSLPKRCSRAQPVVELRFPLIPAAHSPHSRQQFAGALRRVRRRPGFVNISFALFKSYPRRNRWYQSQLSLVLAISHLLMETLESWMLSRNQFLAAQPRPCGQG